ncbi:MAG: ATP synthase F1 subunit gamma [Bacteroidales bacterium]|jgi:F-type H+-transporting ATPase subunit gamma|nr:ATP synthase F1 subunit gamma [Bacteroidales bacterium]
MANLKEIRIRIASVQSTQKITGAMKMVSAAKLRRAQTAIQKLRPFSNKLNEILGHITTEDSGENNPLAEVRPVNKMIIVLIASNKGLCGSFNNAVIKEAEALKNKYMALHSNGKVEFIGIGKRVSDYLRSRKYSVLGFYDDFTVNTSFEEVAALSNELMNKFLKKEADKVVIVYNEFKNAATQLLIADQYLPLKAVETQQKTELQNIDYIFEPEKAELYKMLIPKTMHTKLYKAVLDSVASEHGARMTAMHKATENADELIKQLNLTYNKVRQSSITNEIIEIVSGSEALNN